MVDPVTVGAIGALAWGGLGSLAATVAGGVAGNMADRGCVALLRGGKDRIAGLRRAPGNHDVARAVRTVQLQALERVIRDYEALGRPEWKRQPHSSRARFLERSLAFCRDAVGRRLTQPGVQLNVELSPPLVAAIEAVLAEPPSDGPADRRLRAAAALAEDAVLAELRAELDGAAWPDGFERHFREGAGDRARFLDLFAVYIAEQLKTNQPFRDVFVAGKLVHVEALAFDAREVVTRIEAQFGPALGRIEGQLDAQAEQLTTHGAQLSAIQADLARLVADRTGVPVRTLAAVLARMGEADVPDEQVEARLRAKAEEYLALREQWSALAAMTPDVAAVRAEALARIDAGDLGGARALLAEARQRIRDARQAWSREEAQLMADEAGVDRLELRYRAAAAQYARAAALVSFDPKARSGYLAEEAQALYSQGDDFGDNAALMAAIIRGREAAELRPRTEAPHDWAATQMHLGNALALLGAREAGTARLEEAVAAFHAALEEYTRERVPLLWATTLHNLGNALYALGEREADTARLEEAVAAYRAALEERTRERAPLLWAGTQHNLGAALVRLGGREGGTARLKEAVAAYRAALEEYTRERAPLRWAGTQHNLGAAFQALGEREAGTALLEEAVVAYRAALEERTRERVPLEWAMTQNNLGNAFALLAARESHRTSLALTLLTGWDPGTALLEEAVAAYRAALEERTRERMPLDWAATQTNLANVLQQLGKREVGTARLEEAVAAYRAALEERTRERVPLEWAMTQQNLGIALHALGEREAGTARLEEAVAACRAALEVFEAAPAERYQLVTARTLAAAETVLDERRRVEGFHRP